MTPIHVAFCFDPRFYKPAAVAAASLARHADRVRELVVHVVGCELDATHEDYVADRLPDHVEVRFHDLPWSAIPMKSRQEHWTPTVLARLFLHRMLRGTTERVLYLDADVLVLADVAPLYDRDMADKAVLAAPNIIDRWRRWDTDVQPAVYHQNGALAPGYFNSGVMVIDLDRWDAKGGTDAALDVYVKHGTSFLAPDQDALNVQFAGDWLELPSRWNRPLPMPGRKLPFDLPTDFAQSLEPFERAAILHFVGPVKPWHGEYPAGGPSALYHDYAQHAEVAF